jgi:hypothetical protein
MPGRDAPASNLAGPRCPYLQWLVPAGDRAGLTPQDQRRAEDPPTSAVGLVVLVVECGGGAVLLADGVDPAGITERAGVGGADFGGEDVAPTRPASSMWF